MTAWKLPFAVSTMPRNGEFGNWGPERKRLGLGAHRGFDMAPGAGKAVEAAASGVIVTVQTDRTGKSTILGNAIEVRADDGMYYGYAHLAERPSYKEGQRVTIGDVLGHVGNTGTATTGAHLHMTLGDHEDTLFSGKSIDPVAYIVARSTSTPAPSSPSTSAPAYPNGWLGRGSQGPKVAAMQRALKTNYPAYAKGIATDGDFGPFTESVVREFQRRAGLKVDGLAGPVMFGRLGLKW